MLGDRIRQLRRSAGLTQQELACRVGATKQAVSTWENGTRQPNLSMLVHLADELGCTTDMLLERTTSDFFIPVGGLTDHQAQLLYAAAREYARLNRLATQAS